MTTMMTTNWWRRCKSFQLNHFSRVFAQNEVQNIKRLMLIKLQCNIYKEELNVLNIQWRKFSAFSSFNHFRIHCTRYFCYNRWTFTIIQFNEIVNFTCRIFGIHRQNEKKNFVHQVEAICDPFGSQFGFCVFCRKSFLSFHSCTNAALHGSVLITANNFTYELITNCERKIRVNLVYLENTHIPGKFQSLNGCTTCNISLYISCIWWTISFRFFLFIQKFNEFD